MTISIPTTTKSNVTVYHQVQDGEAGYMFVVPGAAPQWVSEVEADKLARYMLFAPETKQVDDIDPLPELSTGDADPTPSEAFVEHRTVEANFTNEGGV